MTITSDTNIRRLHERRDAEKLLRDTAEFLSVAGITRSASWLNRTVRAFVDSTIEGLPFFDFLLARIELNQQQQRRIAENADLAYRLSYADPTGEEAARNVDRSR